MATRPRLAAETRTVTGKQVARLRHAGQLPAVVYGHGVSSENVAVDAHEFDLLRRHVGASTLVDLSVDGGKTRPVLVSSIQVNPISRRPIHVDLFAVRMTEELTVEVQLVGQGFVSSQPSPKDRRKRMLELTEKGRALESRLSTVQRACIARAYREAGGEAVAGFRKVLLGILNADDRKRFERAWSRSKIALTSPCFCQALE